MNWQTDTVRSTFDATSNAINTMSNRESQRAGSTVGTFKKGGINIFGMNIGGKTTSNLPASSIVGMNVNQVETMRNAIEDYCLDIETYLRNLNPTAEAGIAFKSAAVTKALTTYMDNVKTYCLNLVSQLRAFSDKLADVKNQWEIATGNMAESIGSTSGDSFATGTAYTRQIQSGGLSTGGSAGLGSVSAGSLAGAASGAIAGNVGSRGTSSWGKIDDTYVPKISKVESLGFHLVPKGHLGNDDLTFWIPSHGFISLNYAQKLLYDSYGGELLPSNEYQLNNGKILTGDQYNSLLHGNHTPEFTEWLNDSNSSERWSGGKWLVGTRGI